MDYSKFQNALLLGEADFSFTSAFCQKFEGSITATEYASSNYILTTYYDGEFSLLQEHLTLLTKKENVLHIMASVDARSLGDALCKGSRWNPATRNFEPPKLFWETVYASSSTKTNTNRLFDLVIFNCPHTARHGKAPKLLRAVFKQLRQCIHARNISADVVVEMRLRDTAQLPKNKVRVEYMHEEAAAYSNFELIGVYDNDTPYWETLGYEHRMTRRNATCRGLPCQVWRWRYQGDTKDLQYSM